MKRSRPFPVLSIRFPNKGISRAEAITSSVDNSQARGATGMRPLEPHDPGRAEDFLQSAVSSLQSHLGCTGGCALGQETQRAGSR